MPVQKWTCEKCGKSYDTIQEASRCEQTHKLKSTTDSQFASDQTITTDIYRNSSTHIELDLKQEDSRWGVHINTIAGKSSERCPEWLKAVQSNDWRGQGVIIWDKTIKQVAKLSAANALQVVNHLQTNGTDLGIVVGSPTTIIPIDKSDHKPRQVLSNPINLDSTQSSAFLEFLQDNSTLLQQMAEEDSKREGRLLAEVYTFLLEAARRKKAGDHLTSAS